MNVKIQSVKFDADKRLVDFIQAKMDKMDRFVERAIGAQVTLRIDKDDEQGNKVAIVKIDVAGDELLAERRCKTFEEAMDLCLDAIKKQIDKYKEKRRYAVYGNGVPFSSPGNGIFRADSFRAVSGNRGRPRSLHRHVDYIVE